ncbi:tyrosine-protein phosphatase [Promicromonospora sukumoe]|uniref:Protein-tyrosine phosphatase n=1 Tax=Promicromonospora sukumoe TaxID=88382 RepID=A0A7W3J910_9MICO|nr:tyrosine-protein phosphatase [Promicromonospora sukumoe]MBA8808522.1 protein-tyrosine phosphatase [Promicromonospora sukumoe]
MTSIPALTLSAPVNLRDLGGIPVDGGVVRPGFALRADDLALVTDDVARGLVDGGVRAIIDLRSTDELGVTGRGPLGTHSNVSYHHVPLLADIGQAADQSAGTAGAHPAAVAEMMDQTKFGRMYLRMYEGAAPQIVTALAIIAHAPGAVAFHCAAGQDRTGVLAASLLLALGADQDDIVTDYVRTGENSAAIMARISPVMRPLMSRFGIELDEAALAAVSTEFSAEPMRELFAALTERHGDPLAPLRAAGLTDGLVAQLRARALRPAA